MAGDTTTAKQRAAQARCDALLQNARAQIRTVGVDRFSVNEVLRLAGGSKATLVKYFGDRTGLIAAAIGAEAHETMAALSHDRADNIPFEQALETALQGILRFYLSPGALAIYRAVVSSADPKGAAAFYEEGHRIVADGIRALLTDYQGTDVARDIDCADVADQLLHAIRAGIYEQALIGLAGEPADEAAIADRVRRTLTLMLPGLRRR